MILSEFESLLQYINRLHNPENPGLHNDPPEGYVPKMVSDITCKIGLYKNDIPAGRVSRINFVLNTGETKSFVVSGYDFHHKHVTRIKMWLLSGDERIDWYGLTFFDSDRREKLLSQMKNIGSKLSPKGFDKFKGVSAMEFLKGFLRWLDSDPFYMSDDELLCRNEEYLNSV